MNNWLSKLKLLWKKFLYLFPSPLPVGMAEFESWANDILDTYGWPRNDSFMFALAAMVINQGAAKAYRSKYYFNLVVHAAASKEVAGAVFYSMKVKQQAAIKAAKDAEATALHVVANESK